jgi:type II secretory pathway component GspD/PulD (secretin)
MEKTIQIWGKFGAVGGAAHWVASRACLVMVLSQVLGCGAPKEPPVVARETGSFNQPMVLSSRPEEDSAAAAETHAVLSAADWRALEELGPRPIWEKLFSRGHRPHDAEARAAANNPATRPGATQPAFDEGDLPIQTINLPDGKVRIIWSLRSYGGTTVKSARDEATARRTVEITPADLTPLVTVLTQNLGAGNTVAPLPRENAIIITCDKAMKASVLSLLNDLDRPARQVEIEAKIFEVSHDFDFQQGTELVLSGLSNGPAANLTSTFSAKRFLDAMTNPTGAPVQGSVLHLMQAFQSAGVSVDVSFQLLSEAGLIKVVSEPRITVAVGQTGYMLAGQEIPIQCTTVTNNATMVATSYKPVGVQLYITPEAAGPERVKLHTISIVSAISGFGPIQSINGGTSGVINPVIDSREAETAVTVDDGSTLVISGLRMNRTTTREDKIPGLGDVPILGWLFKNHRTQQEQTDLYFFITPTMM